MPNSFTDESGTPLWCCICQPERLTAHTFHEDGHGGNYRCSECGTRLTKATVDNGGGKPPVDECEVDHAE